MQLHMSDIQKEMYPQLTYNDKAMQNGPSSSVSGQLFKVMYVLQLSLYMADQKQPLIT